MRSIDAKKLGVKVPILRQFSAIQSICEVNPNQLFTVFGKTSTNSKRLTTNLLSEISAQIG